jgi:hypothetical protein
MSAMAKRILAERRDPRAEMGLPWAADQGPATRGGAEEESIGIFQKYTVAGIVRECKRGKGSKRCPIKVGLEPCVRGLVSSFMKP